MNFLHTLELFQSSYHHLTACFTVFHNANETEVLGNSGKPVTLETSSLTKFLRYVFQEQGIHDFREPWTCEASCLRICDFRGSWIGEDSESWTRESLEPRTGKVTNFGGRLIREYVRDLVRKSCAEKFTNQRRSKVKVVVPKSPGLDCELVAGL
jgi:hypothetical protein